MIKLKVLSLFSSALLIASCAQTEQTEYVLTDSLLRTMQAGDSKTFAVLNADSPADKLESYSEILDSKSTFLPNADSATIFKESYTRTGNLIYPFTSRLFQQDDEGNVILLGVTRSGEEYWIVDENHNAGEIFLPNDLSTFSEAISISSALKRCENQICELQGQLDISIEPAGTETIETNFGKFETYKVSIEWDLSLFDSDNATNSFSQLLRKEASKQWIHPALGVVKFIYQVQTDSQIATLLGNLTQTNISIPERYKK